MTEKGGEGPFTHQVMTRITDRNTTPEECLRDLNAHVFDWLSSHGWAGKWAVDGLKNQITELQKSLGEWKERAERLAVLLRGYRDAQQDMLDDWSEGDRKVKDALWCNLHDQKRSLAAIDALAAHDSMKGGR